MLLEVRVWASHEWYEVVRPKFDEQGFIEREDLGWSDPDTDGEYMGCYFEWNNEEGLAWEDFCKFLAEIKKIIEAGEAPDIKFYLVKEPDRK